MRLPYNSFKVALKNSLLTFNTTTAAVDLSQSLTTRIVDIDCIDIDRKANKLSKFPAIYIKYLNKSSEAFIDNRSNNVDRQVTLNLDLCCIYNKFTNADDELEKMVENVDTYLRYNIDLNGYQTGTVKLLYINPTSIDFKTYDGTDSFFNRSANINLEAVFHVRGSLT